MMMLMIQPHNKIKSNILFLSGNVGCKIIQLIFPTHCNSYINDDAAQHRRDDDGWKVVLLVFFNFDFFYNGQCK